jgi:hypothetical protein
MVVKQRRAPMRTRFGGVTQIPSIDRIESLMATLQQKIAEKFLAKLAAAKNVDADKIDQLRALLASGKRPKAEDFVKIFALPAGGDVK